MKASDILQMIRETSHIFVFDSSRTLAILGLQNWTDFVADNKIKLLFIPSKEFRSLAKTIFKTQTDTKCNCSAHL